MTFIKHTLVANHSLYIIHIGHCALVAQLLVQCVDCTQPETDSVSEEDRAEPSDISHGLFQQIGIPSKSP